MNSEQTGNTAGDNRIARLEALRARIAIRTAENGDRPEPVRYLSQYANYAHKSGIRRSLGFRCGF